MPKQRGQAAIIGITALAVIGLIVAVAVAAMALREYRMADDATKGNEVFTATESAMSDTLMRIKKNPDWPETLPYSEGPTSYLNGAEVTVTITEVDDDRLVEVLGAKASVTRKIQALFYSDTGLVDIFEVEP